MCVCVCVSDLRVYISWLGLNSTTERVCNPPGTREQEKGGEEEQGAEEI